MQRTSVPVRKRQLDVCLTPPDVSAEPDAPTDVHFGNITEDSAVVSWFAPRAKVTGYRLFLTAEGSNPKQLRLPARLTEYTLLNLTPDTAYSATLHAEQENTLSDGETATFTTSECVGARRYFD